MKFLIRIGVLVALSYSLFACDFFNVPENDVQIKGEKIEQIQLSENDYQILNQIFTISNPIIKEEIKKYEKLSEEVILIGSTKELLYYCPDSITPPEIDFNSTCLIFSLVATPTTQSTIRNVELYLQANGTATFYTNLKMISMDNIVSLAVPYGIFKIHEDKIKHLKIIARRSWY